MKKEYTAPKMEIVEMEHQGDLLECSGNGNPCEPGEGVQSIGIEEE